MPDHFVDSSEVAQIMQTLDVHIIIKNKRSDGRRPVIIKGAEKNAGKELDWRLVYTSCVNTPYTDSVSEAHIHHYSCTPSHFHIASIFKSPVPFLSCNILDKR